MLEKNSAKYLISIIVAALFSFTLLFFIPMNLFLNNIMEYSIVLWEMVLVTFIVALGGTIATAFLLGYFNDRVHKKITVVFWSLAVSIWLEANFMVWKLGALNGKSVEWTKIPYYYNLDILGWIVLLGLAFWKFERTYEIVRPISIILIMTQSLGLCIGIVRVPTQPQSSMYQLDYARQFELSSKQNVIIFLLDGTQTDFFQELLNEDTQYKNQFKDFTYFRDALSGFPYTALSVPNFLTGQYYDNSIFIDNYLKNAYKNSLPSVLKRSNFDVRVYPMVKYTLLYDHNVIDNFKKRAFLDNDSKGELKDIYEIVSLKVTPYSVKRILSPLLLSKIPIAGTLAVKEEPNISFVNKFKKGIKITDGSNNFRYYHLFGLHYPLTLKRNSELVQVDYNRENYKEEYKSAMKVTEMFIQELKNKGVYDNSLIIIMADHGSQLSSFNQKAAGISENEKWTARFPDVMGLSHPLLLIKRINSHEPFNISDAPVCLADIPRTVADELKINNSLPGKSMFNIPENEKRERVFYRGGLFPDSKATNFLEYKVNGNSWLIKSYREGNAKIPKKEFRASETAVGE